MLSNYDITRRLSVLNNFNSVYQLWENLWIDLWYFVSPYKRAKDASFVFMLFFTVTLKCSSN